ncbi:Flp family type IVb pilin [Comamonas sp. Y6]|uniref:Flp family type IVb pilin n=1 Tax=Comamonas resistens TaxID=3046670 RepID=A0ABY8SS64_9BURK|nr:Flp family type IVb pilin [Comamonas resistens]MDL5035896.1 Flp family type IVb pilin [Comamonas resistens]WHS65300.1 Flp family type IVb pilin [Comamonas resistens]
MSNIIKNFLRDEEGATAIEYGLIAGLIAVAIMTTVGLLGKELDTLFTSILNKLKGTP